MCVTPASRPRSSASMKLTFCRRPPLAVAFKVYDMDRDGFISNGELFLVLKMMVGNNLKDGQLQQIVDKTIMEADKDGDGKLSFDEFVQMVSNTVRRPFSDHHPDVLIPVSVP